MLLVLFSLTAFLSLAGEELGIRATARKKSINLDNIRQAVLQEYEEKEPLKYSGSIKWGIDFVDLYQVQPFNINWNLKSSDLVPAGDYSLGIRGGLSSNNILDSSRRELRTENHISVYVENSKGNGGSFYIKDLMHEFYNFRSSREVCFRLDDNYKGFTYILDVFKRKVVFSSNESSLFNFVVRAGYSFSASAIGIPLANPDNKIEIDLNIDFTHISSDKTGRYIEAILMPIIKTNFVLPSNIFRSIETNLLADLTIQSKEKGDKADKSGLVLFESYVLGRISRISSDFKFGFFIDTIRRSIRELIERDNLSHLYFDGNYNINRDNSFGLLFDFSWKNRYFKTRLDIRPQFSKRAYASAEDIDSPVTLSNLDSFKFLLDIDAEAKLIYKGLLLRAFNSFRNNISSFYHNIFELDFGYVKESFDVIFRFNLVKREVVLSLIGNLHLSNSLHLSMGLLNLTNNKVLNRGMHIKGRRFFTNIELSF